MSLRPPRQPPTRSNPIAGCQGRASPATSRGWQAPPACCEEAQLVRHRCHVLNLDDDGAKLVDRRELWPVRADLSPAERALHVGKRVRRQRSCTLKLNMEPWDGGRKKSSQIENSFVVDTARRQARGALHCGADTARAAKIPTSPTSLASLDKGEELDTLAEKLQPKSRHRSLLSQIRQEGLLAITPRQSRSRRPARTFARSSR